ncbi:MAG: GH92 family glycosyl hydrolase [Prolixibacteraceae bacterium]|nr:GH92 family glycosyl hydrolase [Prolixibacteraceae bacterium]
MMLKKVIILSSIQLVFLAGCQTSEELSEKDFTQYVNPIIGTAPTTTESGLKHGGGTENNAMVQPSVTMPFGMTNWSPQTTNTEKKCVSSYYYKDTLITGFRGSHWLSGSCTQEYGSTAVMPIFGQLVCNPAKRGSTYDHATEISKPNYYKVELGTYQITSEMTATTRCGLLRFTFQKEGDGHIVVNPNSDEGQGFVQVIPEKNEIVGFNPIHRIYQGWGKPAGFSGYFVMRVEKTADSYGVYSEDQISSGISKLENQPNLGAYFSFKVKKGEQIKVKIGTSFVSIDQARKNLDTEIPDFDFETVQQNLKNTWNEILSKIEVETQNNDELVKFYTAMFHSFQQPRTYNDIDGQHPRFDGNDQTDTICNGNYYGDVSAWDTYRALHPLYNLIAPEYNADMVKSILAMGKVRGWIPIFPQWNSYTAAMIGDHAVSIVAEAYIKGTIDLTEAEYQLMKHNATETPATFEEYVDGKSRRALPSYLKYGYIPLEDSVQEAFHKKEQVSRTLEYAYDDFCLAQVAKKMGKTDDYNYFMKRGQNYRNVFDPAVNNMNGRFANGTFTKEFDKNKKMFYITEGTPWQYNWYVPQDVEGLIGLMGGKEKFNQTLDAFFADGQYWHGNEPGHQIPFMYTYSGEPWKSTKEVRNILKTEYGTGPGGLSGNDDSGQMSAWYIFGAIGFYPVCPSLPEYAVTGPVFEKVTIKLGNGKTLVLSAPGNSEKNCYVKSIRFNNKAIANYRFSHADLLNGGTVEFEMTDQIPVN